MQIDWITVSAQIVNFLVLVWLLKRFLYQPVIRAMERREQRIADRLNNAEKRERQADEKLQRYRDKSAELDRRRDAILAKAREKAEQQKKKLLDEAREELAATRADWRRQVSEEKREFLGNLRRQAAEVIQELARKALGDLADAGLEESIVNVFIARLKALDKESRKAMVQASGPVSVATTFELQPAVRSRLTRSIHEHLADGIEVHYKQSPELLCGIELSSGEHRLSWNLADYLDALRNRVEASFAPIQAGKEDG